MTNPSNISQNLPESLRKNMEKFQVSCEKFHGEQIDYNKF